MIFFFFFQGECLLFLRDVVRIYVLLFSLSQIHYPFVYRSCDHLLITCIVLLFLIYIYIYDDDDVCCYSPISPCVCVCVFLSLSLNTCFFMYAILYFCFTLRYLDEFCFKCFKKTGCQNLSCHELSSRKFFQEFVLGLDFIVFNK